jgi:hypothetical protein
MQLFLLYCFLWSALSLNDPTSRLTPSELEQAALVEAQNLPPINIAVNIDFPWKPYVSPIYGKASLRKYGDLVLFTGLLAQSSSDPPQSVVAALAGAQPANRVMLNPSANTQAWKCQIGATGAVSYQGGGGSTNDGNGNYWLSLDGAFWSTTCTGPLLQLASGWSNKNVGWQAAVVNSIPSASGSLCWVEGVIQSSAAFELATPSDVAAQNPTPGVGPGVVGLLPAECRPAKARVFHVASWHQKTDSLRVVVKPSGEIILTNTGSTWAELRAVAPNAIPYVSLNGIVFDTSPITSLALTQDFSPVSCPCSTSSVTQYQEPGYSLVGPLCVLAGSLSNRMSAFNDGGISPITTDEALLANLPAQCQPTARLIFAVNQWASEARVDATPAGELLAVNVKGAQSISLSLDGIIFDTKSVAS